MVKYLFISVLVLFISWNAYSQEMNNAPNYVGTYKGGGSTNSGKEVIKAPRDVTPQEQSIKDEMMNMKHSGNTDFNKLLDLQKQLDAINSENVTVPAGTYNGTLTQAKRIPYTEPLAIGNTRFSNYNYVKSLATATESNGRIWSVVAFQGTGSSASPDSLRFFFSTNNGVSWNLYALANLGGTDKFNGDDMDVEILEPASGDKYMYVVYGLRATGGTGRWFTGGLWLRLTGTFGGGLFAFAWPGDDPAKRYYNIRLTSDNTNYPANPFVYIACSFDSLTTGSPAYRENAQKFLRVLAPYTAQTVFSYKADKLYWWMGGGSNTYQRNLFTDIAYFKNTNDSLIVSFSGVPDSTKLFFSKHDINGTSSTTSGQIISFVGGSEPTLFKTNARLASNGNNNGAIVCAFRQLRSGTGYFDTKYFRTTNFGNFNSIFQSGLYGGSSGAYGPDIVGDKNQSSFRWAWLNYTPSFDSVYYISFNAGGIWYNQIARMNPNIWGSTIAPPRAGYRGVAGDSCFVIYDNVNGAENQWAAFGCSGAITGVINNNITPVKYNLAQNYPNPFNPTTKISFDISKSGLVSLKVYDMLGREVRTLVNEVKSAGSYTVDFNASDFSSGVYFYKLKAGDFSDTKKLILMK